MTDVNVQTFLITNMDHITEDYRTLLAGLTHNSKLMIDKLSKLAWDNETHAAKIVEVIEIHLQQV